MIGSSKREMMENKRQDYPSWVLDQLGIETMLANRVAMGKSVTSPRFLWVPFVDALMLPLNTESYRKINPDNRVFFTGEDRLLKRYLSESKISALPLTLDGYQTKVGERWTTEILPANKTSLALSGPGPAIIAVSAIDRVGNASPAVVLQGRGDSGK